MSRPVVALESEVDSVPPGWKARRLDSLATEKRERAGDGHALPVLSVTKHSGIVRADNYFKKSVHSRDTANYKVVRKGDLAYATIHLDEGSIGVLENESAGIVSPMYTVFRPTEAIDARYLFCALKLPDSINVYRRLAEGTVNRRASIGFDSLGALHLLHPPLDEQRKIAAILSSVDDAIEATQAVIDQLQVVKKAMMAELLTRGVPGRHPRLKQTEIGEMPEEWDIVRIGDVCSVVQGSTPRPAKDPRFFGGSSVPWITVGELSKDDWPYLNSVAAGLTQEGCARSRFLEAGTVVLSNSGFGCGVPKILGLGGCANDGIAAFLQLTGFAPLFLYYLLASMTEYLRKSVARGVEQPNLNTTLIGDLRLPQPPDSEQREIAEVMLSVDERLRAERAVSGSLMATKTALSSVLLTGEVRVNPDEAVDA
jgi:type I restriction enzyme, S subunit